ncbi:MAG: FtsW/RodA/SpoVE family cell cycle protein, partial [Limnobacter sp.]|nr:FtsW/RodA/SpoVE family cell cycle protein [Limnobacter sp.]
MLKQLLSKPSRKEAPLVRNLIPATSSGMGYATRTSSSASGGSLAGQVDQTLIWLTLGLCFFGMIMVYSATIALPDSSKYASYRETHFLWRHVMSLMVAFLAAFIVFQVPMSTWQKLAP